VKGFTEFFNGAGASPNRQALTETRSPKPYFNPALKVLDSTLLSKTLPLPVSSLPCELHSDRGSFGMLMYKEHTKCETGAMKREIG
jgi:hypothetical protein